MTTVQDTGLTPIGNGVGAGFRGGMAHLVWGPEFARIERERRDGPRYVEAIRGARVMRYIGFTRVDSTSYGAGAAPGERSNGAPLGSYNP